MVGTIHCLSFPAKDDMLHAMQFETVEKVTFSPLRVNVFGGGGEEEGGRWQQGPRRTW